MPIQIAKIVSGSLAVAGVIGIYKNNPYMWSGILSFSQMFPEEFCHDVSVKLTAYGLLPSSQISKVPKQIEDIKIGSVTFPSPLGIAAGFDKQGECIESLLKMGFGFVEIGTVTPLPQVGNPKPRLRRLVKDRALVNRFGFNSSGSLAMKDRLNLRLKTTNNKSPIFVSIGCNKDSTSITNDYCQLYKTFSQISDFIVINVSSPNTLGLRSLQQEARLTDIFECIEKECKTLSKKTPIFIKLSPDLPFKNVDSIIKFAKKWVLSDNTIPLQGFIISNTTKSRNLLRVNDSANTAVLYKEDFIATGGLSGPPVKEASTKMIKHVYKNTGGLFTIVGVGGIENGKDALEKIKAGASLIQIYTSFVYQGPPVVDAIRKSLADLVV